MKFRIILNKKNIQMIDIEFFIDRLKLFIEKKDFSVNAFEDECDIKNGVLRAAIRNKKTVGSDKISKILLKFPELNANWLLTGKGDMIESEGNPKININQNHNGIGNNQMSIGECERELQHLKDLLAEKDKRILLLEKIVEKI